MGRIEVSVTIGIGHRQHLDAPEPAHASGQAFQSLAPAGLTRRRPLAELERHARQCARRLRQGEETSDPKDLYRGGTLGMPKTVLAFAAATLALTSLGVAAPAAAQPPPWAPAHGRRAKERAVYDSRGGYIQPRRITRDSYLWRGSNGRYYCKRDNGTTGLVIGAGVGALAGYGIAGSGDRTLGAILGGTAGALIGREIDRGSLSCR
ncbi:17 kDa surface antigen [Cyanobium sp. PCC 7001]|uniref:glycine zipper 2TM domain-containing protein n=1 Tax=Cyanobium sp. PCC 7001 TaxID=180281 RepID=UPI00018056A6|nr:glycine zipper 2TM domain-containing protein [Cyanobium sp. PCC 7001]EDY37267.1 17 kDa surface antigen [Cyanobium sp. PCC 7001]